MTSRPSRPAALRPAYAVALSIHAVERFRERFADAPIEAVAAFILTPMVRSAVAAGARRVTRSDGVVICADRGMITTIYWRDTRQKKAPRNGRETPEED